MDQWSALLGKEGEEKKGKTDGKARVLDKKRGMNPNNNRKQNEKEEAR